ncbi:MAG TPA: hypothetical protein VMB72_08335 [Acidimicrobiales bacterium]|nr:hypothetical protein [Acidimicrobiales bacterium]
MSVTIPSGVRSGEEEPGGPAPAPAAPAVVYLAAAKNTYGTVAYRLALHRMAYTWPQAVVMDADACGFASRADWLLRWPFIRDGIDGMVVLSEGDGTVSHDTWLELRDARERALPVWLVARDGALVPASGTSFRLYPSGERTTRRWARASLPGRD